MSRAVFLDRDGVINHSPVRNGHPYAPTSLKKFQLLPDVTEALKLLRKAHFYLIIVTNQPDVGKGEVNREIVEQMHNKLRTLLPIDDIKVCYHTDEDRCECRKPKPGMLLEAAKEWTIELTESFMVGDRWRDIGAGKLAGCKTILIDRGYQEPQVHQPEFVTTSLLEASKIILQQPFH